MSKIIDYASLYCKHFPILFKSLNSIGNILIKDIAENNNNYTDVFKIDYILNIKNTKKQKEELFNILFDNLSFFIINDYRRLLEINFYRYLKEVIFKNTNHTDSQKQQFLQYYLDDRYLYIHPGTKNNFYNLFYLIFNVDHKSEEFKKQINIITSLLDSFVEDQYIERSDDIFISNILKIYDNNIFNFEILNDIINYLYSLSIHSIYDELTILKFIIKSNYYTTVEKKYSFNKFLIHRSNIFIESKDLRNNINNYLYYLVYDINKNINKLKLERFIDDYFYKNINNRELLFEIVFILNYSNLDTEIKKLNNLINNYD